jgi:hypothetical protein
VGDGRAATVRERAPASKSGISRKAAGLKSAKRQARRPVPLKILRFYV